jgi:hypothetical protein
MTIEWTKLAMAAMLFGTVALSACETTPSATTGLQDPSSDNAESVPFDAWFKDRPQ